MQTGRHVIFLGAGASKGSGYPLANGLRLLISSRKQWEKALDEYKAAHSLPADLVTLGLKYWDSHASALELFRNGGFGTLDEFCNLAGRFQFQGEINGLRSLVRAALGLFNPEEHFEESEYYGFVQALFKEDLLSLRDDITILTYNYDPYLEFLLYRALEQRWKVTRHGKGFVMSDEDVAKSMAHQMRLKEALINSPSISNLCFYAHKSGVNIRGSVLNQRFLNAVTSGLNATNDRAWLGNGEPDARFCVLKLHGCIAKVNDEVADFDTLFLANAELRAKKLLDPRTTRAVPPILFPWEIVSQKGLVGTDSIFRGVWERARRDVQSARKISFVGLSMHAFLEDGLNYLFSGKEGATEVVVANPNNAPFMGGKTEAHWSRYAHAPAQILSQTLSKIAPKMKRQGRFKGHSRPSDGEITLVEDFAAFVSTQMNALQLSD